MLLLCPTLAGAGVERRVYLLINRLNQDWNHIKLGLLREQGEFLSRVSAKKRIYFAPGRLSRFLFFPIKLHTNLYNLMLAIGQTRAILNSYKPAIVVTFTLESTVPMFFATRLNANPAPIWIISEDSNTAVASTTEFRNRYANQLLQKFLGHVYRKADFITTVSSTVLNSVQQTYKIPPQQCNVIHNPIDLSNILSLSQLDKPYDFDYIVAVGRLVKVKQFDLLIKSFSELEKFSPVKLVILGEGQERANLAQLVSDLNLTESVYLPGFADNPWVFMKHAKMLVLTSQVEGFGNVLVEAMAVGCPVITTNSGGPTDIIKHNINGLTVTADKSSIATAIKQLLDNPDLSSRLCKQAAIDIQDFNPINSYADFDTMLRQQLASKQHNNPGLTV